MNPLEFLKEREGIDATFVENVVSKMQDSGMSLETVLLEVLPRNEVRTFFAEYYQIPEFAVPEGYTVTQELLN